MRAAYLDTSFLLAILFDEPGASGLRRTLGRYGRVFSSDLLTAETLSAAVRERLEVGAVMRRSVPESFVPAAPRASPHRRLRAMKSASGPISRFVGPSSAVIMSTCEYPSLIYTW